MVIFPNAKINLGLNIVAKRDDGFHDLQTCFIPIPYYDILEIIPAERDSLVTYNANFSGENILVKARDILREKYDFKTVAIHLYKNIPVGGGLGGGSSDAAFLLKALNELFQLNVDHSELLAIASVLGKDCPFFLKNAPVYAEGTGDIFSDIEYTYKGYYLSVATPNLHISTKDAFSWITPGEPEISLHQLVNNSNPEDWSGKIRNDFQDIIEEKFPVIKDIREKLEIAGSIYTSLSGTGSSVYGFFKTEPKPMELPDDCKTWIGKL